MSNPLKQVFNKDKTFRPKRKFEPGTQRFELHKRAQASLNAGLDLKLAVQLPSGEEQNDWVAVHVVDFFNRINLIYGTISDYCTEQSCPIMSGGPKYEYRWQDEHKYRKPTALSAPKYLNLLMDWIEVQINNEDIFPTNVGTPFPKNFLQVVKKILSRLFRVFVHVYIHHFDRISHMGSEAHVNTCYKHFYYFVKEFNLIDTKELEPLIQTNTAATLKPMGLSSSGSERSWAFPVEIQCLPVYHRDSIQACGFSVSLLAAVTIPSSGKDSTKRPSLPQGPYNLSRHQTDTDRWRTQGKQWDTIGQRDELQCQHSGCLTRVKCFVGIMAQESFEEEFDAAKSPVAPYRQTDVLEHKLSGRIPMSSDARSGNFQRQVIRKVIVYSTGSSQRASALEQDRLHLLKKNDRLRLIKCVRCCTQLGASKAVAMQPCRLVFLLSRSYSWVSHGPQRQRAYAELFQVRNSGNTPLKFVQLPATRWLSVHGCCVRVLDQWDELKLHFQLSKDQPQCYDAELLHQMYCGPVNKLHLQFLTPILHEFSRINKLFQLESGGNAFKMLDPLLSFFQGLLARTLFPKSIPVLDAELLEVNLSDTASHLPLCAVNFGAVSTIALGDATFDKAIQEDIKSTC
ncbi:Mps one binder kinase activator-like 2A [Chelonia mydas]|uniref:Mps one binder kinase activator-like 2A n=1 Tax=Chelonia mydas TaxID=8469 RepID=M7ASC8_CHEMY|nr:Mps one binder kinase activator-like 2A [Chelonia mydas]